MSSEVSEHEIQTEFVYQAIVDDISEDVPMEKWSSLIIEAPEENPKRILYEQGLYSPGSGEICTKYVSMSASSILRHPYFNYPAVLDPGIKKALLDPEEKVTYPNDGQELYMKLCKEMNKCPVRTFCKGLITDSIDLRYYCVDPFGVRAMALALQYNKNVKILNLTDNFLNEDACYHLGEMLIRNSTLTEINLTGCKIGHTGVKQLCAGLHFNRGLQVLNLNRNQMGDMGLEHLSAAIFRGINVNEISLSCNGITGKSANILAEALETYNKLTHIDLSWNNLYDTVGGTVNLFSRLAENKLLQELNVAWNSLTSGRIGTALKLVTRCPNLRVLNLSNNKLTGEAIQNLIGNLEKGKKMVTLNLSYNPLTPDDALKVLSKMKLNSVKIQNLLMENVFIDGACLMLIKHIKEIKSKNNVNITYGGIIGGFRPSEPDMREIVLNRVEFLTKKKRKVDIALVAMQLLKDNIDVMPVKDFGTALIEAGAVLDADLLDEIANAFSISKNPKVKILSVRLLVDYIHRKWPDRKLPPTPPPEPEPEPIIVEHPPNKKGKDKKKKLSLPH